MTNEEKKDRDGLRHGLPRLLVEDPNRLSDLLELTRKDRLRIATLVPKDVRARIDAGLKKRPEPVQPGESDRVVLQVHYGHPGVRQAAWKVWLERGPGGKPSPEAIVLADFVDAEREARAPSEESADDGTESERIADRAWADTRERLARWEELKEPEREQCVLRTFAVATIRDDPAVLTEAVVLAPELRDQFKSLLPMEEATEEAGSVPDPPETASDKWTVLIKSLKDLASRAEGPPPEPDLLEEITTALEDLRELEPSVRAELSSAAFDELLAEVRGKFDEIQADSVFWLNEARRTELEEQWSSRREALTLEPVKAERRRFAQAFDEAAEQVRAAARDLSDATNRIAAHRTDEPDDPFAQENWSEALADLQGEERACRKRHREAQAALLTALAPRGEGVDAPKPSPSPTREPAPAPEPEPEPEPDPDPKPKPDPPKQTPTPTPPAQPQPEKRDSEPRKSPAPAAASERAAPAPPERPKRKPPVPPTRKAGPPEPAPPKRRPRDPLAVRAEEAITAALMEEPPRLAYAFQAARLCERTFPEGSPPRSRLLEATLLADRLRTPDGAIAMRLRDVLADFPVPDPEWSEDEIDFQATVRFAACLRPAVFAPVSGAYSIFSNLLRSERYPALHDLGHRVAGHAARLQGARVDASFLHALRSEAELNDAREACREAIAAWRRDAPRKTMPYQPATAVWQRLVQSNGPIGQVMANLDAETVSGEPLSEIVARWRNDRAWLENLLATTDRKMRGFLHSGARIGFRAQDRIVAETRKAGALAQRYLGLAAARSDASDYRVGVLSELRDDLRRFASTVREQLSCPGGSATPWVSAGARLALHAVERLRASVDPQGTTGDLKAEPDPGDLLASGFFSTRVVLDHDDQPIGDPSTVLSSVVGQPARPFAAVVDTHLESGDPFAASRILNWMETEEGAVPGKLRVALDESADRHRRELSSQVKPIKDKVETGLMLGSVTADERERYEPALIEIERQLSTPNFLRVRELRERLRDVRSELEASERKHLHRVRTELADLALPAEGSQAKAIKGAIEQGDIVRANEWIQRVREDPNFVVTKEENRSRRGAFFPDNARKISAALENAAKSRDVVERIRAGKSFGGLPPNLPGARLNSAARMLEAWFALKRRGELGPDGARQVLALFTEIGFRVQDAQTQSPSASEVLLRTVTLDRRDRCPVPTYGSAARGCYRVVCVWKRPTVEDLLRYDHPSGGSAPPIILYFGRLSETQRKDLALATRKHAETILTLDEVAVVFLCGERDSRLPVFFDCTLPFSYVQPYSAVGGVAPPEMFYGRDAEMARVTDKQGSCFVYGGRQIGKTAILRAVRDRYHRPSDGHYVFFVDLKAREMGVEGSIADIWPLLWRMLHDGGAIPKDVREPSTKGSVRIEEFLEALIRYFAPATGRTLLLLLDEADHFLEMDAREQEEGVAATGYRESIRLKRLMDETERSIKVVFAGLHNVLRTVEQANHPLGQFGRPVQVEPLLRNGGMRAAHDLVTRPLRAAGYRLEPDDLITRILGQTNYYPGLIQAYCAELIGAMLSRCAGKPPYKVTSEVIEAAYRDGGLREFIRGRFHLTLNLDKRYEIIAYSIASLCLSEESALVTGFPRRTIYEEAATWWPAGFADLSGEEFASLLDETVGLGVLRTTGTEEAQTYTLRNPNVLLLMGTKDQIEERLLEKREPPQPFEPRILRARRKPDDPDDPSRSPLTFQQQSRLFADRDGVVLVSGTAAADLNALKDLLRAFDSQPKIPLVRLEGVPDRESFRNALRGSVKRQERSLRVHAVPPEAPWTGEWIRDARSYLNSVRKSDRHVRVLFLAGGDRLPDLMRDPAVWKLAKPEKIFLEPWRDGFVRQWMQDVAIGDSAKLRGRIIEMTGCWPALLMRLHELTEDLGTADLGLEELETELSDSDQQQEWQRQLCLDDPVTCTVLRPLAVYGELSQSEVMDEIVGSGVDREEAILRLRAAGYLGLARPRQTWSLNPFVARLLGDQQGD